MTDRTVHATGSNVEIVRYDRAGKWYIEGKSDGSRKRLTLSEAVDLADYLWRRDPEGTPHFGRPGGQAFDRAFQKRYPR